MGEQTKTTPRLLVLLGPTAVGKSELAIELAAALNAEIISGDSLQFYRYMDIGTAKIRPAQMLAANGQLIPHHLLDVCQPDAPYSVADFQQQANRLITEINRRGRLPLLVGGSMLYLDALTEGYSLAESAGANAELRAQLRQAYRQQGAAALHRQLQAVDPAAAAKIAPQDEKRLLRALEIWRLTGQPPSRQSKAAQPPYHTLLLGLNRQREQLYQRIDQRVEAMLEAGLLAETRRLLHLGYQPEHKPLQALGYRQCCQYLAGLLTYAEMRRLIKRDTRHFAKRQLTWWRRNENIHWFWPDSQPPDQILAQMLALVNAWRPT